MKVLLIGGNGSIGRRYAAILRMIGVDHSIYDPAIPHTFETPLEQKEFDRAIVAAPTRDHWNLCRRLISMKKPFLCEKPLSTSIEECENLVSYGFDQGYVVCNWKFLVEMMQVEDKVNIEYDYFRTGTDGTWWDVCQLVYLDPNCTIRTESPVWTVRIDGVVVPYAWLERAYVKMLRNFCYGREATLWSLEDGLKMTRAVEERMIRENTGGDTGKNKLKAASR